MKPCPHEAEAQAVLRRGHWPDACDPELRKHVETCDRCAGQLVVLHAFQRARSEAVQVAHMGHPSLLWWRAQLRRRNDALERVGKPITTAQIFALCISIVTAVALFASQMRKGVDWSSWLPAPPAFSHFDALSFFASVRADWGLILLLTGFGTLVLLSALVVYLASDRS